MQRIDIMGNLAKDCEVRDVNNDKVINFEVAVNEGSDANKTTTYYKCTLWKKDGKGGGVAELLKKGKKVFVSGKPSAGHYTGKDGVVVAFMKIAVYTLEI
jgi:single-strand DNA-binding protein